MWCNDTFVYQHKYDVKTTSVKDYLDPDFLYLKTAE